VTTNVATRKSKVAPLNKTIHIGSVLLALLALPRLRLFHLCYANERPRQPPEGYPVWPLWYVAFAMTFVRTAGGFFVLGLLLNVLTR